MISTLLEKRATLCRVWKGKDGYAYKFDAGDEERSGSAK